MKGWTHKLAALGAAALIVAPCAAAQDFKADIPVFPPAHGQGKLDLDIYASSPSPLRSPADAAGLPLHGWVPGDPHDQKTAPTWVKHLSHVGYAGLGIAGLAASVASGGVAPAVGFGIIALWQSWEEWRQAASNKSG